MPCERGVGIAHPRGPLACRPRHGEEPDALQRASHAMDSPRLARVNISLLIGGAMCCIAHTRARADIAAVPPLILMADTDDDDVNGRPDGEEDALHVDGRADLVPLDTSLEGATLQVSGGTGKVRVWQGAKTLPFGGRVTTGAAWQGLVPGRVDVVAKLKNGHDKALAIEVRGVAMRDTDGKK